MLNVISEKNIYKKIQNLRSLTSFDLKKTDNFTLRNNDLGRDVEVLPVRQHPLKKGLSFVEGQARLLHDLASIELQAMELGVRTLIEFNFELSERESFKNQLIDVVLSEADHLELCLNQIHDLGFKWGDWPVHTALWDATHSEDSLIDRILIVHRYLEGSGLDAGDTLLNRLKQVAVSKGIIESVKKINHDEVLHVLFGSNWFKYECQKLKLDSDNEFESRMNRLKWIVPKRMEPIQTDIRLKAGFSHFEISYLKNLRSEVLERHTNANKTK